MVPSACVRAVFKQSLNETCRVDNNAAADNTMERSIALIVAPIWIRSVCKKNPRNIG